LLKPVGFWSYARQDDNYRDGDLSQLRTIVGKAISSRQGEEVTLWQDTVAIPFGADWAANIEDAIRQVTFFIPVLTPAFLKSKNCLDEFEMFRRRMADLGRDDLIFPIHYVDVERIAWAETVFGDELAALRRQQWIDFRPVLRRSEIAESQAMGRRPRHERIGRAAAAVRSTAHAIAAGPE
jgi:hypothetical protein